MVTLTKAPENWEILQQTGGYADATVTGTYDAEDAEATVIFVGALSEDDMAPVIGWQRAVTGDGRFSATLRLPVGGLYRIEVRGSATEDTPPLAAKQWAARHHIGVGDNYLIAGQSNAAGVGRGYVTETPDLRVHVLRDAREWDLATHPLDTMRDRHNPWLSFAKTLARSLGYPIGLIPTAVSGSQIRLWLPEEVGTLYRGMRETVERGNIGIRGVIWYQGCAEAMDGFGDLYLGKLRSLITHLREDFADPELPILLVQINRHIDGKEAPEIHDSWGAVREAQRQAAHCIPHVFVTTASDSVLSDGIHNAPITNAALGERVGRLALGHLYGRGADYDAADLTAARLLSDTEVELTFAHLHTLVTYGLSPEKLPIRVADDAGEVALLSYTCARGRVRLSLARPVVGRVYVSAMDRREEPYYLVDGGTQIPILAFHRVEATRG